MKFARALVLSALVLSLALPAAASREDASDGKTPPPPAAEKKAPPAGEEAPPRVCAPASPSESIGVNTLEDLYRAVGLEWAALPPATDPAGAADAPADPTAADATPPAIRWTVKKKAAPAN